MRSEPPSWAFIWRMLALLLGVGWTTICASVGLFSLRGFSTWADVVILLSLAMPPAVATTLALEHLHRRYNQ